jgi:hypothetical protein
MIRALAAIAFAVVLAPTAFAQGLDKYDPAVKKLMPKDQLELVEKIEVINEQSATLLFRNKDAKKRGEENERLGAEAHAIHETITQKLKTEGLKDWVGTASTLLPGFRVILDSWQPIRINLEMKEKKASDIGKALAAIKINDIIRFSTKPDDSYTMPKQIGKTYAGFDQLVKIGSITAVEKIGVKPGPGAKK